MSGRLGLQAAPQLRMLRVSAPAVELKLATSMW
jgi:hypothetical protein